MVIQETERRIKSSGLRFTQTRRTVLDYFIDNGVALAQPDLEKAQPDLNRVSLYRTLHSFVEAGLLHRFIDDKGVTRYALCAEKCNHQHHQDQHLHFHCLDCGQHSCLSDSPIPRIELPEGYQIHEIQLVIRGLCRDCAKK